MATMEQLKQALINADKAGDTAAAQKLAAAIRERQAMPTASPTAPAAAQPEQPGLLARAADIFTGNLRETEQTQTLPDWASMPEMNQLTSPETWKAALGTLMSGPDETAQVLKANFPNMEVQQDAKGNYLFRSPSNGQWYAYKPGFQLSDVPRAGAAVAAFTPAGRATSIAGAGAASAGTQAAIEASQAAAGGEFSPAEVATSGITGAAMPAVTKLVNSLRAPVAQAVGQQADTPIMMQGVDNVPQAAPKPAAPVPPAAQVTDEQFGLLARKASSGGVGSVKAKEELAKLANINPEAKAAAERLGIDLPADVLSDARQLQEAVGLSRALKGTEQSAQWAQTIEQARQKADDALAQLDASPDIATVSETIKQSLGKTRADLESSAKKIYEQVDAVVPKQTTVNLGRTQKVISDIISEVGEANLSAAERRLYQLASNQKTTYGAMLREKSHIGKAMEFANAANPYGSVETGTLKRLYGALAEDQLDVVGTAVGNEARDNLRYANQLTAKRKGLEQRIVKAFGKEGEGSISTKLTAAIRTGAKGDITQLNKVIKTVPEPLRKEALASALMAHARTTRGDFSFGAFESMYQGLRKNAPVYAAVAKEIGPESEELLRSLYVVSRRINAAEAMIPKTGLGNQALLNSMAAQGTISKILEKVGAGAVAPAARVVPGVGGMLADAATNAIKYDGKEKVLAAGKFLTSPDFTQLIEDVAKRGAEKAAQSKAVRKTAISPAFAAYANRVGLPKGITVREQWIRDAILASKQFNEEQK